MADGGWRPDSVTVIGAGSGIGRAIALEFAERGMSVAALSRSLDNLRSLRGEAHWRGTELAVFQCDAARQDELQRALAEATSRSVVVHTAGTSGPIGPVWECDLSSGVDALSSMVLSPWLTAQMCLSQQLAAGSGVLLLASSGAASKAARGRSAYCMSKAAVDHLVRVVGAELSAVDVDVGVAAFYPGMVDTGMQQQMRDAAERYRSTPLGDDLAPFALAARSGSLLAPAAVAGHIADLAMRPPRELNGKIWRLRDNEWTEA
jgi:benzil reductase ((S)-benzoin forming)